MQDLVNGSVHAPALNFEHVDCRSSLCLGVLVVPDPMEVDLLPLALADMDVSGYTLANAMSEHGQRIEVIFNR